MANHTSGVRRDDVGWYAFWNHGFYWDTRQTLRTPDKAKAEQWLRQGNCHGASAYHKPCPYCK